MKTKKRMQNNYKKTVNKKLFIKWREQAGFGSANLGPKSLGGWNMADFLVLSQSAGALGPVLRPRVYPGAHTA